MAAGTGTVVETGPVVEVGPGAVEAVVVLLPAAACVAGDEQLAMTTSEAMAHRTEALRPCLQVRRTGLILSRRRRPGRCATAGRRGRSALRHAGDRRVRAGGS